MKFIDEIITYLGSHNHEQLSSEEITAKIAEHNLKQDIIKRPEANPETLYEQAQLTLVENNLSDKSISSLFTNYNQKKNTLNKIRARTFPKNPNFDCHFKIDKGYELTVEKKKFLQFDNKNPNNRIIIFFSEKTIKYLESSKYWFCDGTFKYCPTIFMQLYVIHGIYQDQIFPAVFILMQHRNKNSYNEAFGAIKEIAISYNVILKPEFAMLDFESAPKNSLCFHFPGIQIKGCWFHFTKALFKQPIKIFGKSNVFSFETKRWISKFSA